MKKILFLLLLIPCLGFAQTASKYLAGAVPVVDGKVTFTQTLRIPNTAKADVFNAIDQWAKEQFKSNSEFPTNQLITEDPNNGLVAGVGEEFIVFSQGALSLDRTRIYYQLRAYCEDNKCTLTMTRIRYWYNEGRDGGEKYNAEEIITDEYGLTKKQDKPAKVIGKFRVNTIDYKDDLFKKAAAAVTAYLQHPQTAEESAAARQKQAEEAAPAEVTIDTKAPRTVATVESVSKEEPAVTIPAIPAVAINDEKVELPVTPASVDNAFSGYRSIEVADIPGNIYELLSNHWMLITAGNADDYNTMTASWGGLGNLYQSPVAFCFINPSRYTYQYMEKNDTYTLSFFPDEYKSALKLLGSKSGRDGDKVKESGLTPVTTPGGNQTFGEATLIIECQKMVAQSLNPEALKEDSLKQQWEGKTMHKMYIGRILRVWTK